jgi:hypothetical protein
MKTTIGILVAAVMLVTPVLAAENATPKVDREKVVKNLLFNLNSENKGVRESSAYMLGELQYEEGIIPLMGILHNDPNESSRIVAALSLSKIGAARGTFAVKQAAFYDESQRVRGVCAWFSNQFTKPEPFVIPLVDAQEMSISETMENELNQPSQQDQK